MSLESKKEELYLRLQLLCEASCFKYKVEQIESEAWGVINSKQLNTSRQETQKLINEQTKWIFDLFDKLANKEDCI